jgi:hypothetical protein
MLIPACLRHYLKRYLGDVCHPTPLQAQAIPIMLDGYKNLLVTGEMHGKTIAY